MLHTKKKLIFFWHYEPWICQEGPKNNKKYFQERFLKKRSLDTFNSDGSHQAETTSPSRGAVVFDTSYPTPNSYIMCKFLFDLSIYVQRFDRKKGENLDTLLFFWHFWHLWKKFDILPKKNGFSNLTIGSSFVDNSRLGTSVVGF